MTLEQVLTDPTIEAVTVETEEIYLTKYAQLAAEHGKHIQMEKPGGESLEAFERLIETVRRQGKVFHTGYMYRYNPVISDTLARARRGELGEVVSVEAQMSGWWEEESTKWLESLQGGMMFYLGCHLIDLVLLFQGEPERVAIGSCPKEFTDMVWNNLNADNKISLYTNWIDLTTGEETVTIINKHLL
jgi:predicted dehydrogenase